MRSFVFEGGWLYLAAALVAAVLVVVGWLGSRRATVAAGALLGLTLLVGVGFTLRYATLVDTVQWYQAGEPSPRVRYERCVAAGRSSCESENPVMSAYLQHRLLGVFVPLAGLALVAAAAWRTRRR